jgi:hypothetical protein
MKKLAITIGALALPLISSAQQLTALNTLVGSIGDIVKLIIPILFALAMVGFFYGLVMYIFGAEQNKDQAKKTMIWGVVALFVMASVWGLVAWLGTAVGVGTDTRAPDVNNLIPQ